MSHAWRDIIRGIFLGTRIREDWRECEEILIDMFNWILNFKFILQLCVTMVTKEVTILIVNNYERGDNKNTERDYE